MAIFAHSHYTRDSMSIARNLSTVGSATLASRVLALVRDMGVAAVLGAGPIADAFFAALQIPNLFRRLLAEGAVNGALVPLWLRLRATHDDLRLRLFGESTFGTAIVALGFIALVCMVAAPLIILVVAPGFAGDDARAANAASFLRLSILYIALAGVVAIAAAILNAEGRIKEAAASIVAFNAILVVAVLVVILLGFGETRASGQILAASFVVAGLVQLALVGRALLQLPQRPRTPVWKPTDDARVFYARALPALIAAGVPQLALIVGTIVASTTESAVSWLYYAYRLYELPLGVISIAIASVLAPRIAASVHDRMPGATQETQSHALELAIGLALPATIGLILLALPVTSVLFQRGSFTDDDTFAVAAALAVIVVGLPGHATEKVLGAISFAHEDTRLPMRAALIGLAAAAFIALVLVYPLGHVGVAAGIALAGWVSSGWLFRHLRQRGQLAFEPQTRTRLGAIGMSTLIMAAMLVLALALLVFTVGRPVSTVGQLITLIVLVGGGLATYAASLHWYRIIDLPDLIETVRRRV